MPVCSVAALRVSESCSFSRGLSRYQDERVPVENPQNPQKDHTAGINKSALRVLMHVSFIVVQ